MGTYTMALKSVLDLEKDAGNGYRIGLSDYPIFDAAYRDGLNQKIINHYYNREIGQETISIFAFNLRRKMFEIMPTYNQVYASTLIDFDPLSTFDLSTTRTDTGTEAATTNNNTTGRVNSAGQSRAVNFDTPQTQLSENEDYATSGADSKSTSLTENSGTGSGTTNTNSAMNGNSRTKGYQGSAADLLMKFRATIVNVDMMIINELSELFMGVWDNGDEMLPSFGSSVSIGGYGYGW
jgi:hypothetical protein